MLLVHLKHLYKAIFQNSIKLFGCIPPALGDYGLPTCKDGSKYPMSEINDLIDCPQPCAKYTMRVRSEYDLILDDDVTNIKIIFKEMITVSYDQYSYIWLNLVAEVGGYVGLFLGFSVFQMTDLMDVLLQRNWIKSCKSLINRFKTRVATGTRKPKNPIRPKHKIRGSGKTKPDPNSVSKPAGTLL